MISGVLKSAILVLSGAIGAFMAVGAGMYVAASKGLFPAHADAPPPKLEKWFAKKALKAAVERQAPKGPNPVPETDANLLAGIKLYAADCAVCHGTSDARASDIALGLYQKAPQLGRYGVEDDEEGETYWKVYHGIRMTGMPAFRESLSENEIWQIVLFLKRMNDLPPGPQKAWEALPSAARRPAREVASKRGEP